MYFKYKYKLHFQNVFQIQNTNMYFKYVFQIHVFEILPSTDNKSDVYLDLDNIKE